MKQSFCVYFPCFLKLVHFVTLIANLSWGMLSCPLDSNDESVLPTVTPNTMVKITDCNTGDFYISNTELTYSKWYEVYQWAVSNGYVFQNLGREGNSGIDGA